MVDSERLWLERRAREREGEKERDRVRVREHALVPGLTLHVSVIKRKLMMMMMGWGGGGTAQWWTASDSGRSDVLRSRARSAALAVTALQRERLLY